MSAVVRGSLHEGMPPGLDGSALDVGLVLEVDLLRGHQRGRLCHVLGGALGLFVLVGVTARGHVGAVVRHDDLLGCEVVSCSAGSFVDSAVHTVCSINEWYTFSFRVIH